MLRSVRAGAAVWFVAAWFVVGAVGGRGEAYALSPSRLIVFGDSLSDMGNIDDATFGVVPGSSYHDGRFSNGPVWVERLASDLGLGPLAPSRLGGTNFAYGGAQTTGANGIGGVFIRDLDEQLADYRAALTSASQAVDPNALYVVWAGANDLFDGQTDVNGPVGRVASTLQQLVTMGARQFLVPNIPILGRIPNYNRDPVAAAKFDLLSHQYNAAFETAIENVAAANLQATFYRLDVAEIFSDAIARPAAWGLTNVTDPAAPGLDPGRVFYNEDRIVAHPEQYLFWDTIHPTAVIHQLLGDFASRLLDGVAGDFDSDGEVDAADLALWSRGLGATGAVRRQGDADGDRDVDGADFLLWQRNLGVNLARPTRVTSTPVPEPRTMLLSACAASLLLARARREPLVVAVDVIFGEPRSREI